MTDGPEMTRRGFIVANVVPLATIGGGGVARPQVGSADDVLADDFQALADLIGPIGARPDPGDPFFEDKPIYAYRYSATDSGERYFRVQGDAGWTEWNLTLPSYPAAEMPADVPFGFIAMDENRDIPTWFDGDGYEHPTFVNDVLLDPVTVADTSTRTVVFNADIDEGSLVQGRAYELHLAGRFSTSNNSDQFTTFVDLAGVEVASLQNQPANTTDVPWSLQMTFTVRDHGVSGTLIAHSRGLFNSEPDDASHAPVSVDTTTATALQADVQWGVADPGNSVTLEQAYLQQMS